MPRPKDYNTQTDRRTARLFVIGCEGEKTELIYFSALAEGLRRVSVVPLPGLDGLSAPEQVLDRLNEYKAVSPNSEYWLVIDVDRWFAANRIGKTHKVLDEAAQREYGIAISNPCIEMWLLLHFELPTAQMSCNDCEARLKTHFSYDKGRYEFEPLRPHISDAVKRARELDTDPTTTRPPSNPNSHVYRLIEAIHQACGDSSPFDI